MYSKLGSFLTSFSLGRAILGKKYIKYIPSSKIVEVAGSIGKTTTLLLSKAVLERNFEVMTTPVNEKNSTTKEYKVNFTNTLLKTSPTIRKVLLEVGLGYPEEAQFYTDLIKPEILILTNIAHEDLDNFGSLQTLIHEYQRILTNLQSGGLVIANGDDHNIRKIVEESKADTTFYGTDPKTCTVWAGKVKIKDFQTTFELNYGVERVEVKTPLLGKHQIYPFLAATTLGLTQNLSLISIKKAFESIEPEEHKMEVILGYNDSIIIDDTYNDLPTSTEAAMETLNVVTARRRILVLGEMRSVEESSEKMHRKIAQKIYKDKIDLVFLIGKRAEFIADELNKLGFISDRMKVSTQNSQIISHLLGLLSRGDVVLVKGAANLRLDELVKKITKIRK